MNGKADGPGKKGSEGKKPKGCVPSSNDQKESRPCPEC